MLDKSQNLSERDDFAGDLCDSDLPEVEAALVAIASDRSEDELILDTAGHSLWIICDRQKRKLPDALVAGLQPEAQKFFVSRVTSNKSFERTPEG
ncbi:MAG TPA: hypothetical protein VMF52_20640 [Steroidobacteraceae bacterium]|nr:hypothetical protein [Steroidobacteraceae bacterium]